MGGSGLGRQSRNWFKTVKFEMIHSQMGRQEDQSRVWGEPEAGDINLSFKNKMLGLGL